MQEIEAGGGRTVRSWASLIDPKTLEQAKLLARHPNITAPVALMPDAHLGIGATVGSVVLCEGGIIPSVVGVDIGCGVTMLCLDIEWKSDEDIAKLREAYARINKEYNPPNLTTATFREMSGRIRDLIPAGVGQGHSEAREEQLALMPPARSERVEKLWSKAREQFATLGAGNHFVEISATKPRENVWTGSTGRMIRILVHSGSRGIGNTLATEYIREAGRLYPWGGNKDLGCIPEGTDLFNDYITDMQWAQDYAYMSRIVMVTQVQKAFYELIGRVTRKRDESMLIACHHNYAVPYTDPVSKVTGWLSRKGAIDAHHGVRGVIPGSMGTATYVVRGKGEALSYNSAPHGAGRLFSRGEARRTLNPGAFRAMMGDRVWQDRDADKLIDEAPDAYKDITQVMEDAKELVSIEETLTSIVNYKGL